MGFHILAGILYEIKNTVKNYLNKDKGTNESYHLFSKSQNPEEKQVLFASYNF
jgi:hypothetical protein